ncbi:hypothetical protein, partial [Archangium violaceum]
MSDNSHAAWDAKTLNHRDKPTGYGCLWRHDIPHTSASWATHPCNYRVNGYKVSLSSRSELYNKDHQQIAKNLGLVTKDFSDVSSKGKKWIWKKFPSTDNSSRKSPLENYFRQARKSLDWLRRGKEGWHIGISHLNPTPNHPQRKGNRPQFQPRQNEVLGGYGAFYPYEHNFHHLIPIGAIEEWVIGKGTTGGSTRSERIIKMILFSRWNIHNEKNIILLPNQQFEARIVGLPAHCPWDIP